MSSPGELSRIRAGPGATEIRLSAGGELSTGLKRALNPMPDDIRAALAARGLEDAYEARPPYQRNDWLGWIGRAKREETRKKRLDQMLDELEKGGVYMKMKWSPTDG